MRRRVAIWFEGHQEIDQLAFMFFILSANNVQKTFFFCFPDDDEQDCSYEIALKRQKLGKPIYLEIYDFYVFITQNELPRNIFFQIEENIARITTATWERYFSPPSIFQYLLHSILCAATYSLSDFRVSSHREFTSGCQFEYTRIKSHDRVDIALGYICDEHQQIVKKTLGAKALKDLKYLFSFAWLGKEEDGESPTHKLKMYFRYDINKDSGYTKSFLERAQPQVDTLWFDFLKEIFKGIIFIITAFLLFKFGLAPNK